ncbi:MAG: Rid family detoxifying hydrolase [Candidatus Eremiobacteraeota bacterium]|nr:Rid family detoxifying hydrolase [Candidatus Eremiobacteraeota bacterium]
MPRAIFSQDAPQAIGPYSQAFESKGLVFCSGQVGIVPAQGKLIQGDAGVQTQQVMENLGAVLRAADLSFADVAKTTLYLVDMSDFAAVNAVYAQYFNETKPARATLAVSALPLGARVEIEAIAVRP